MSTREGLFSRNWAFLSAPLQERLAETKLFVAGTGLGGVAAVQAARTGFGRFILADGDRVEVSNMNRQPFLREHTGRNKAEVIGEIIRDINPDAEIELIPNFLGEGDFEDPIQRCDLIINTIDFEGHALTRCNQVARELGKTILFPLNIGWGGALYVLPPDVPLDSEPARLLLDTEVDPVTLKRKFIQHAVGEKVPDYLQPLAGSFLNDDSEKGWPYDPQMAAGAALTSALIVRCAVAIVAGEKVRHVPDVIHVDFAEISRFGSDRPDL